jgi:hypothetical protein
MQDSFFTAPQVHQPSKSIRLHKDCASDLGCVSNGQIYTARFRMRSRRRLTQFFDLLFLDNHHAGDLIFVPWTWGHAVINVAESIGYAQEFYFGQSDAQDAELDFDSVTDL